MIRESLNRTAYLAACLASSPSRLIGRFEWIAGLIGHDYLDNALLGTSGQIELSRLAARNVRGAFQR